MSDVGALRALFDGSPSHRAVWTSIELSTDFDPDLPYTVATRAAYELFAMLQRGDHQLVDDVLNRLESSLARGTPAQRNLLIVGLIEDLQNILLRSTGSSRHEDLRLGRATDEAWSAVERLWLAEMSASEFNQFVDSGHHPS